MSLRPDVTRWLRKQDNPSAAALGALFRRAGVAIAGRDGTTVQSGGTGSTSMNPMTGAVVADGGLVQGALPLPGIGTLPMFLAQGARTNLLLRSQTFNVADWTSVALQATVADGAASAPDGTVTAAKLIPSVVSSNHYVRQDIVKAAESLRYTLSFYAKEGEYRYLIPQLVAVSDGAQCIIDLRTGLVVTAGSTFGSGFTFVSASCTPAANGFYRVVIIADSSAAASLQSRLGCSNANSYGAFSGDAVSGIYFWGAQLEQASFPSLYIPTTAASLTRTADNILWTPPAALSTTSGEVVAIAAPYLWSAGAGVAHPGGGNQRRWSTPATSDYDFRGTTDGCGRSDVGAQAVSVSALADASGSLRQTTTMWDAASLRYYRGDSLAGSDATLSPPYVAPPSIHVGSVGGGSPWFGFVGLIYVPGGLTNDERSALARLTAGSLRYVV